MYVCAEICMNGREFVCVNEWGLVNLCAGKCLDVCECVYV